MENELATGPAEQAILRYYDRIVSSRVPKLAVTQTFQLSAESRFSHLMNTIGSWESSVQGKSIIPEIPKSISDEDGSDPTSPRKLGKRSASAGRCAFVFTDHSSFLV